MLKMGFKLVTGVLRCKYTKTTKISPSILWMLLGFISNWARQRSDTPRGEQDPGKVDEVRHYGHAHIL